MDEDLEKLLQSDLLTPPVDFPQRVMRRVQSRPAPAHRSPAREVLRWAAMAGAGALAMGQLAAFILGMWAAVTAL
jgi:hypothetical protein